MKKHLTAERYTLETCCGVDEIGEFEHDDPGFGHDLDKVVNGYSGTGLVISAFIDSKECRQAYEFLKDKYKILYQSDPYRNRCSGNLVFLVVYFGG
ncbi:hypothetical protein UFOVP249_11 [uncultured Caudovirales phage]|uniref:Uncharacterized protein n=1 Tax=uncultured Caudovirales phage TaxID=2100421 RepID=A0A6J5LLY3_9CAUD|nr:hypothetical protein UFOVP249_11 [uncultured Caudovirales phage]